MNLRWDAKSFSGFKVELLANFAGTAWSGAMQLLCIPFYIKFMGIEAYGLIGFYLMLQATLQVLDLGLSPTMSREMACYSVQPEKAAEARDLVRTLETGYWLIGLVIGASVIAASPWIGTHWIKASAMTVGSVSRAVMLMGILAVFQWPVSFYQGGLMGLSRQVLYNGVAIVFSTLASLGGVLILWLVSPTIQVFFLWLVVVNAAKTILLAVLVWTSLPHAARAPRLDFRRVRSIRNFAAGMSGITLISLLLTQIDKVVLSKLLSLQIFGYYTLAWSVASGLLMISGAVFNVVFPRMSAQVARGDESAVRQSYHRGSQLMAVMILPLASVILFFSFDILRIWTRSSETAALTAPILRLLVIGSALNAVLFLPYALQLAFGWTKLTLLAGLVSLAIVVPVMYPMTKHFGAVGAAAVWAILNIVNLIIVVPIMHRRLLPGEARQYFGDVGLPLASAIGMAVLGRLMFANSDSAVMSVVAPSTVWLGSLVMAVLAAPLIRSWVLAQVVNAKLQYARGVGIFP